MTRTNQGGSVLSFVVVALVLVGLLIGGAYTIRKLTTQPDRNQSPPAPAQQDKSSDKDKTSPQNGDSDNTSQSQATTPTPSSNSTESQSSSPAQLPQTGPKELLGSIIAIAALSGMAVSYARSRRPELSL